MHLNLYLVSKNGWDISSKHGIVIKDTDFPILLELLESIYDLFPQLDPDFDYKIYWQNSPEDFQTINDWITYNTSLTMMADSSIYLLVNDVEDFYGDTREYLRELDFEKYLAEKVANRSKYDVEHLTNPNKTPETLERHPDAETDYPDKEILAYAVREEIGGKCFTKDLLPKYNLVRCMKKGWPKLKKKLTLKPDEVIERKAKKGKKDEKGKGKGKGKGKDDKSKSTKKSKSSKK